MQYNSKPYNATLLVKMVLLRLIDVFSGMVEGKEVPHLLCLILCSLSISNSGESAEPGLSLIDRDDVGCKVLPNKVPLVTFLKLLLEGWFDSDNAPLSSTRLSYAYTSVRKSNLPRSKKGPSSLKARIADLGWLKSKILRECMKERIH